MSFRLVSFGGVAISSPAFVSMYASGTIHPGGVVSLLRGADLAQGFVIPATSGSTQTQIFGVALDYAQGASDVLVNVIPFAPGQIWEADCINSVTTIQVGKKFSLSTGTTPDRSKLINNNSYDQSGMTGIFLCYNVTSASTGSGKIIGEFVRTPLSLGLNSTTFN